MDENVYEIKGRMYCPVANILCADGTIEEAMQLQSGDETRFWPLKSDFNDIVHIQNWWYLYNNDEKEYEIIRRFLSNNDPVIEKVGYCQLLNLRNKPEDIRYRQKAVKLLCDNKEIYDALSYVISNCKLFELNYFYATDHESTDPLLTDIKPENVNGFLEDILQEILL